MLLIPKAHNRNSNRKPDYPEFIITKATPANFHHLTGVVINQAHILRDIDDKDSNINDVFFIKSLNGTLTENDFDVKDHTTQQKMNVLTQALMVAKNAKMIADFYPTGRFLKLNTEKLTGGVNSCIGFIKSEGFYVPNTVLDADIRDITMYQARVLAVLSKSNTEKEFNKIERVGKKIDIGRLLEKIKDEVPISQSLLDEVAPKHEEQQNTQQGKMDTNNMVSQVRFDTPQQGDVLAKFGTSPLDNTSPPFKPFSDFFKKIAEKFRPHTKYRDNNLSESTISAVVPEETQKNKVIKELSDELEATKRENCQLIKKCNGLAGLCEQMRQALTEFVELQRENRIISAFMKQNPAIFKRFVDFEKNYNENIEQEQSVPKEERVKPKTEQEKPIIIKKSSDDYTDLE